MYKGRMKLFWIARYTKVVGTALFKEDLPKKKAIYLDRGRRFIKLLEWFFGFLLSFLAVFTSSFVYIFVLTLAD